MFKRLRLRFSDMKTIAKLIPGADEQARAMGEEKPGAEHFVLSALNLEDGTAMRVFSKLGVDSKKFKNAIKDQYHEALDSIGIHSESTSIEPDSVPSNKIFLESQPSGENLMKLLVTLKKEDKQRPLTGAHVLIVAASAQYGVVPRALKSLNIDKELLVNLAREELVSVYG